MWNDDIAAIPCGSWWREPIATGAHPVGMSAVTGVHPIRARTLLDTASIVLRPLGPESAERFSRYIDALSAESRAFRFLIPVRGVAPDLLKRLVDVDQRRHVAWAAEDIAEPGVVVAEVRYAIDGFSGSEFAVSVADAYQDRGLGRFLMRLLLAHAAACGIGRMTGTIRADNLAGLALARRLGFALHRDRNEAGLVDVTLGLRARGRAPSIASYRDTAGIPWPRSQASG